MCSNKYSIIIVNKKHYKGKCEYVGRPSILGNIYSSKDSSIAKHKTNSVEESIKKYKEWLYREIDNGNDDVILELYRLANIAKTKDLILGCWCFPFNRCHAEVIKEVIETILELEND